MHTGKGWSAWNSSSGGWSTSAPPIPWPVLDWNAWRDKERPTDPDTQAARREERKQLASERKPQGAANPPTAQPAQPADNNAVFTPFVDEMMSSLLASPQIHLLLHTAVTTQVLTDTELATTIGNHYYITD